MVKVCFENATEIFKWEKIEEIIQNGINQAFNFNKSIITTEST